ncbi:acetolactate synthase large subunit [Candidatus Woesearchaeota archaeon]|nr:acetolactate synthase large subunit [Candidatus Woesearchaeota archaeon]
MKASDLFVRQLEEEGVTHIFGLPGEENLDMLESLRKSKQITVIITRHEQTAAFMAATYGRLTGKAGVCFSTLGPGATNLVTGIAHAQLIGAPLVAISGQKPVKENWQGKFQVVDIVSLMRPITKDAVLITDAETIPTVLRNSFKLAESERPGAVQIVLPEDVATESTKASIQKRTSPVTPFCNDAALQAAVEVINQAEYPLIIVSAGANRRRITDALTKFINHTGIYVVHTQMGKGVIDDRNEYSLFATGIHSHDYVNCGIDKADLIITIGYNVVEYPPYVWNKDFKKKIVTIDGVPSVLDKYYNPDVEVIGDISVTLERLTHKIIKKRSFPLFKKTRDLIEQKMNEPAPHQYPLVPAEVVRNVRDALGQDDIIAFDNGIYKLWFSRLYKTYKPNTFLVDNALATMGAGLSVGIAAKMLHPEKKVLVICGDGGFMMNSQEIESALRYKIPLVILIINDNGFGFIKWEQQHKHFPIYGMDYGNPDFVKYAESYGAQGMRVNKTDNLGKLLERAFALHTVVVIDCPIDYSVNYDVFSRELKQLVCPI